MQPVRNAIARQIRQLLGSGDAPPVVADSGGDAGLFGPSSVCWRVHGDFTTMMIGGVAALLLQMLHPGALAGVWDHSNFRQDMSGRLRRTARFIAGTTYGTTEEAMGLIGRVRSVHDHVHGRTADGLPYSAHDPELLTWVHTAEVCSFLAAYRRYREPAMPPADQDRYFAETAKVAELLGARDVPDSRAAVQAYFQQVRPDLRYDERTRAVATALLEQPAPGATAAPFAALIFDAAKDLLPDWAARMHGFRVSAPRRPVIRLGVRGVGAVLRWGLQNGAETRARRRTANLVEGSGSPAQT